jgi:hypothetical protein
MFILIASLIMSVGYATINSATLKVVGTIPIKKKTINLYASISEFTKTVDSVVVDVVEGESYFDINVDATEAYKNGNLSFRLELSLVNTSNLIIGFSTWVNTNLLSYMDVFCSISSLVTFMDAINPGSARDYYIEVIMYENIPEEYTSVCFSIRINVETCTLGDASECFVPA